MAVVETTSDSAGRCLLRTSVSTTGVYIIGTLREYLQLGSAGAASWQQVVHWSSHHPAFSRAAEQLDTRAVDQALSLNVPAHVPCLLAMCVGCVEDELLPLFLANPEPLQDRPGITCLQEEPDHATR